MKRLLSASISLFFLLSLCAVDHASAISLSTSFKAPLTMPYAECNADTSTTDCTTGSMDLQSVWVFTGGTV